MNLITGNTKSPEEAENMARVVAKEIFETLIDSGVPLIVINIASDMIHQATQQQLKEIALEMGMVEEEA